MFDRSPEAHALVGNDARTIRALLAHRSSDQREILELRLAGLNDDFLCAIPLGMDLIWDTSTRWGPLHPEWIPFGPTRPFTVRFWQMTAAPDMELPQDGQDDPGFLPPCTPGLEVAAAESGNAEISGDAEAKFPLVEQAAPAPGGTISAAAFLPAGANRTIRSARDKPLLLYALTIVNTGEAGPATARP